MGPCIQQNEFAAAPMATLGYFRWAFITTAVGLLLGAFLGWRMKHSVAAALSSFFICAVLAILEISLSFDKGIVNANKLKHMTPEGLSLSVPWSYMLMRRTV